VFDEIDNLRERAERQWAEAEKLEAGSPYRLELLLAAGETFAASEDFARGDEAWALALAESREAGEDVVEARVLLQQAALGQVRGPEGIARYHEVAAVVRPVLEEASDAEALYTLHQNAARAYAVQGDAARARAEAELALAWAERAGREDVYATYLLANLELEGAGHVSDVLARAQQLLASGRGLTAFALGAFAEGNAWLGQFDQARVFVRQHVRLWHEAGRDSPTELEGVVELWAGEPAAAEAAVRPVVEAQEAHGDLGHGAGSLVVLSRAVLEQGRVAEALALLDKLGAWAAPDDVWTQGELRMLRGRALGDEALVREAIALLEPTEYLNVRGRAWLELHALAGEGADRALELFERKGNVVGARLAVELVERTE
jgi:tetratricopeptide (TPR) repeat protein